MIGSIVWSASNPWIIWMYHEMIDTWQPCHDKTDAAGERYSDSVPLGILTWISPTQAPSGLNACEHMWTYISSPQRLFNHFCGSNQIGSNGNGCSLMFFVSAFISKDKSIQTPWLLQVCPVFQLHTVQHRRTAPDRPCPKMGMGLSTMNTCGILRDHGGLTWNCPLFCWSPTRPYPSRDVPCQMDPVGLGIRQTWEVDSQNASLSRNIFKFQWSQKL